MGLLNFFTNESSKDFEIGLSLDIGTEFVKAILFKKLEDNRAEVIGVGRQRQRLGDMQGGRVSDIAGVINNSQQAIIKAEKMAGVAAEQSIVGIAGELVKGTTTTVEYSRTKSEKIIDKGELRQIIETVQEKSFEQAKEVIGWETGQKDIEVKLVNSAIVKVEIDGYKVTNPIGFQGKKVEIGIFNAFAPAVHMGALETIADNLELDLLAIAAEPYAVARSVGLEDKPEFSAVFIDIGGGTTDVAVVRNGGVEGTKMFAFGGRTFTKRLAAEFDYSFSQAEEMKIEYSKGQLSSDEEQEVRKALSKDSEVWLSGVELTLDEFSELEFIPGKILLCGGGSLLPEVEEKLMSKDWQKNLPFSHSVNIDFIRVNDIETIIDKTGHISYPIDITPMALANLALDLIGQESKVNSILDGVIRSLRR
jgi:cell division protein FtsA